MLRQAGVLRDAEVVEVEVVDTGAFNSETVRLRVRYDGDADGTPTGLVLKRPAPNEWSVQAAADEVRFYRLVGGLADHPAVVPRCWGAGDDYLLLEDLSSTHHAPLTRDQIIGTPSVLPDPRDAAGVIETLARLQAFWWEHPLQGSVLELGYWSADGEGFESYAERRTEAWQHVVELPAEVRELYAKVVDGLPAYWDRWLRPRVEPRKQLTLQHGDAYFSNFQCPSSAAGTTYLLDWQGPCFDLGAGDLVNLMATFWTREQRADGGLEHRLLRQFHEDLRRFGVRDYGFDDLCHDYRLSLVFWLLDPVQDARNGSRRDYWWPKMRCLAAAFQDWDCLELVT